MVIIYQAMGRLIDGSKLCKLFQGFWWVAAAINTREIKGLLALILEALQNECYNTVCLSI